MAVKKKKPLSKKEHIQLFHKVENEGFDYYMMHYGPDLEAIERLGFDSFKVEEAIELLKDIQEQINVAEQFLEEHEE